MADPSGDPENSDDADLLDEEALIGAALLSEFDPEDGDEAPDISEPSNIDESDVDEAEVAEPEDVADDVERTADSTAPTADSTRTGRSPLVLIMVPLLVLVALAVAFASMANGQRSDANAAVDAAVEGGSPVELCGGSNDSDLDFDGYSREQPLVLSSIRLDQAAVTFIAPTDESDEEGEPMVDVIDLELEDAASGWCISSWDTSTRLASN